MDQQVSQLIAGTKIDDGTTKGHHVIWTACRFIERHPGCNLKSLEEHLDDTYPIGTRIRFSWILGWVCSKSYGNFVKGLGHELDLFEKLLRAEGGRSRGIHILPLGSAIARCSEPPFTPEKPKSMTSEWILTDPAPGTLLVSRKRTGNIAMSPGGEKRSRMVQCTPNDVLLFQRVISSQRVTWGNAERVYGRPYLEAVVEVLHGGNICHVDASLVKPLEGKGGKNANR